ncbi:hypothetical protein R5H32_05575 [Defluviimonas sp. D31]|uniref:hypothetical protein n=1 Tax=Defluviimonas sp. D31 TaxID=3083253 RepID=UPI00296F06FA|nr:hypothetical protein [Defluviimonas sp. D31]MDW4548819.1 hypothetical protein [Defluviimonas sp. D31]
MESKSKRCTGYAPVVAVLTGDIVASRKHDRSQVDTAMARIAKTAAGFGQMAGADSRFTRFRGDGWQIVLGRAGWALRAALILIADLKTSGSGIETRISAGIGPWESLGTANLSDASGPAFSVSGDLLEAMPRHRRLAIAGGRDTAAHGTADRDWQAAIFDMAEWISSRWSQPQAEAMSMALGDGWTTQDELARRLGITRQAMHSRLTGAGYQAMENALAAIEHYEW